MNAVLYFLAYLATAAVLGTAGAALYGLLAWVLSALEGRRLDRSGGGR